MKKTKHTIECAKIYGVATQTASYIYDSLKSLGDELDISYVPVGSSTLEDCDVAVISGIETLFNVAEYLHKGMQVIISDGPLLLMTVKNIQSVDYSNEEVSYIFKFQRYNPKLLYKSLLKVYGSKKNVPTELENVSFDALGMIQQGTIAGDYILSFYNRVLSSFDMLARNEFKKKFVDSLSEKGDTQPLLDFLNRECVTETHKSDAKKFLQRYGKRKSDMVAAFKLLDGGKSVESISKKYDISAFELNYIRRMREVLKKSDSKTDTFNKRALGEMV